MSDLPAEITVSYVEVGVQEQETQIRQSPAELMVNFSEIGVQEQETQLENLPSELMVNFSEVGIQEQETTSRVIPIITEPIVVNKVKVVIRPASFGGSVLDVKLYIDGVGYIDSVECGVDADGNPYGVFLLGDYIGKRVSRVLMRHSAIGWSDPTNVFIYDYSSGRSLYSYIANSHMWDTHLPNYSEYVTVDWAIPNIVDGLSSVKCTVNIIRFVFAGKAYLFDGKSLSSFPSFGEGVIYPLLAFGEGKIVVYGGLKEDNTIFNDIYIYGQDSYVVGFNVDGVVLVIAGDEPVYVYDSDNNIVAKVDKVATVPVLSGWKVASRTQFTLFYRKI